MNDTTLFTPHLKPGEHIVWSARFSDAARKTDRNRTRVSAGTIAVGSAALAVVAAYRFYEAVFLGRGNPSLSTAFAAPLFFALSATFAVVAFFMTKQLIKLAPPHADYYGATNNRLLAVDSDGKLVDEMAGGDIAFIIFNNDRKPTELHVVPRADDGSMFYIAHLDDLRAVKARIAEIFPHDTLAEATS